MEWLYEWGSTPSYVNWKFGEPDATEESFLNKPNKNPYKMVYVNGPFDGLHFIWTVQILGIKNFLKI